MKQVAILGATGSIGASALDVVARHPQRYRATALTAGSNVDALVALCERFAPDLAVIAEPALEPALRGKLVAAGLSTRAASGRDGLREAATLDSNDTVVAAIVGSAGLDSTLAAASTGKRLLLANKEAVVMAGPLLFDALRASGGELIPIDSEHNAIFQCLPNPHLDFARAGVRKVLLTASGGPFRGKRREDLGSITPDQACAHPNWRMGRKISVDSATLMNKGLEVIEAHWLFGANAQQIEVVVHPQSIVHSLVEFVDGSQLAQLGMPDMRTPIAHALAYPERIESGVERLDLAALGRLEFTRPD
ncbi:MAG TPA: 1-deoxy-D-xylulose-5-phosphate reductoisomerase, partial [Rudaea sp.]|nr:1-deoxy-D-xylulose-5-phosphate reductoisomerase [Rudaea sp.]